MTRKPTEIIPLMLRLRESLRRRLEQAAKHNNQSMNAEIVDRIKRSFERDDMEKMITEVIGRFVKPST
jgi:predicted HicB family RNase H-like nuclease